MSFDSFPTVSSKSGSQLDISTEANNICRGQCILPYDMVKFVLFTSDRFDALADVEICHKIAVSHRSFFRQFSARAMGFSGARRSRISDAILRAPRLSRDWSEMDGVRSIFS